MYEDRWKAIKRDFLDWKPASQSLDPKKKALMSVPITVPILKAHERAHQMRSVERKLRRVAKRENMAKHVERAKDILAEFGLDDGIEHLVIDLPVPK